MSQISRAEIAEARFGALYDQLTGEEDVRAMEECAFRFALSPTLPQRRRSSWTRVTNS